MKGLAKLLDKKYGELVFGLICGCSYFIFALNFIFANTYRAGGLLAMYLFPLIVCGIALVFIRLIRKWRQEERYNNINMFVMFNLIVTVIAVIFLIDFCLHGIA